MRPWPDWRRPVDTSLNVRRSMMEKTTTGAAIVTTAYRLADANPARAAYVRIITENVRLRFEPAYITKIVSGTTNIRKYVRMPVNRSGRTVGATPVIPIRSSNMNKLHGTATTMINTASSAPFAVLRVDGLHERTRG